jgi:CheY-like chemotaxis protein
MGMLFYRDALASARPGGVELVPRMKESIAARQTEGFWKGIPAHNKDEVMREQPRLRVLVVEDHLDSAEALAFSFRADGHEVAVATDGFSALEAVRAERPDVVFLDITLPDIDGYEVARGIQEQSDGKRPLLIALTGHGDEKSLRLSREAGIDLHLVKPVTRAMLHGLLRRFQAVAGFDPVI